MSKVISAVLIVISPLSILNTSRAYARPIEYRNEVAVKSVEKGKGERDADSKSLMRQYQSERFKYEILGDISTIIFMPLGGTLIVGGIFFLWDTPDEIKFAAKGVCISGAFVFLTAFILWIVSKAKREIIDNKISKLTGKAVAFNINYSPITEEHLYNVQFQCRF